MEIPNIFKLRAGAIQLSDLDDNFDIVKVTVNTQATEIATLQTNYANLQTTLANYSAIPIGCIVLWSGTVSTIPSGWRLCDGTNGTPDLRDKFVIGARSDSGGSATTFVTGADTKSGGSKDAVAVDHTHTATSSASSSSTAQVSSDSDSFSATFRVEDGANLIPVSGEAYQGYDWSKIYNGNSYGWDQRSQITISHSHTHAHTVTVTTTTAVTTTLAGTGTSGTNRNLPPYYSLAYIMKV